MNLPCPTCEVCWLDSMCLAISISAVPASRPSRGRVSLPGFQLLPGNSDKPSLTTTVASTHHLSLRPVADSAGRTASSLDVAYCTSRTATPGLRLSPPIVLLSELPLVHQVSLPPATRLLSTTLVTTTLSSTALTSRRIVAYLPAQQIVAYSPAPCIVMCSVTSSRWPSYCLFTGNKTQPYLYAIIVSCFHSV